MVKNEKTPVWKLVAGGLGSALVAGLAVAGIMAAQDPVVVTEYKNVTVEKIVMDGSLNETQELELKAELVASNEAFTDLEPMAVEGQYKAVLQELALEELNDEMEDVSDFLYSNYGIVIDEDDIKVRNIEGWTFSYDSDDLVDEDIEEVDAIIKVNVEIKGEDEISDDNFSQDVQLKFEFEDGKMKLQKIKAI